MLKSALIFGAIMFVLGLLTALTSPICSLCFAVFVGLGAGYVAGVFSRPPAEGAAVKSGVLAGGFSAVGGLVGQLIGAVINAVVVGPQGAEAALRDMVGVAPDSLVSSYYIGSILVPFCFGIVNIFLMAGLGALGGVLWYQISGKPRAKPQQTATN